MYKVTSSNLQTSTVHIFDICLNKYGCYIAHICPINIMLQGQVDSTFVCAYTKTQPSAMST